MLAGNKQYLAFAYYTTYMVKCLTSMKQDLRVIKSRAAIENAFINLVEIKGFHNITIKEIAEKAMVNRNTIYLNYGAKEDILESIVNSSVEKYFGTIDSNYFKTIGINKRNIETFYQNLFNVVDENIELYRILLTDQSSTGYVQTELARLRKNLIYLFKPTEMNKMKISFLTNGVLGVVGSYIKFATGTAEENIKILTDLTISNLRHIAHSR